MYVCAPDTYLVPMKVKRDEGWGALDHLKLKLHVIGDYQVGAGNWIQVLCMINTEHSPAPPCDTLIHV